MSQPMDVTFIETDANAIAEISGKVTVVMGADGSMNTLTRKANTLTRGALKRLSEGEAWEKLQELAIKLSAEVIGEEDKIAPSPTGKQNIIHGRSTWVGWPLPVLGLVVALWWKW